MSFNKICVKKIKPICSKLIFKRLLLKIAIGNVSYIPCSFYRQINGFSAGESWSVTFSDMYMVKMENDVVITLKPKFCRYSVNDIFNRRKKNTKNILFKRFNDYHLNT